MSRRKILILLQKENILTVYFQSSMVSLLLAAKNTGEFRWPAALLLDALLFTAGIVGTVKHLSLKYHKWLLVLVICVWMQPKAQTVI